MKNETRAQFKVRGTHLDDFEITADIAGAGTDIVCARAQALPENECITITIIEHMPGDEGSLRPLTYAVPVDERAVTEAIGNGVDHASGTIDAEAANRGLKVLLRGASDFLAELINSTGKGGTTLAMSDVGPALLFCRVPDIKPDVFGVWTTQEDRA